ncbi:hypothetical protein [Solitalea longa]|nr:hypothetical protein [Solitalea longa]
MAMVMGTMNFCTKSETPSLQNAQVVSTSDDQTKVEEGIKERCGSSDMQLISKAIGCADYLCDYLIYEDYGKCEIYNTSSNIYFYFTIFPETGYKIKKASVRVSNDIDVHTTTPVTASNSGCYATTLLVTIPLSSHPFAGRAFYEYKVDLVRVGGTGPVCSVVGTNYAGNRSSNVDRTPWRIYSIQSCGITKQ